MKQTLRNYLEAFRLHHREALAGVVFINLLVTCLFSKNVVWSVIVGLLLVLIKAYSFFRILRLGNEAGFDSSRCFGNTLWTMILVDIVGSFVMTALFVLIFVLLANLPLIISFILFFPLLLVYLGMVVYFVSLYVVIYYQKVSFAEAFKEGSVLLKDIYNKFGLSAVALYERSFNAPLLIAFLLGVITSSELLVGGSFIFLMTQLVLVISYYQQKLLAGDTEDSYERTYSVSSECCTKGYKNLVSLDWWGKLILSWVSLFFVGISGALQFIYSFFAEIKRARGNCKARKAAAKAAQAEEAANASKTAEATEAKATTSAPATSKSKTPELQKAARLILLFSKKD